MLFSYSYAVERCTFLLQRAGELADSIRSSHDIHIVTHIDADGITAGAIASAVLQRMQKDFSLECVKQLDASILTRLQDENHELVWFTDLGSSIAGDVPTMKKIITDHHLCPKDSDFSFHLNPHLFGLDGSVDISGAGVTYLVARALDRKNSDLSALAIVGACGDLQEKKFCQLTGMNRDIVSDGKHAGILRVKKDIRFFGRETRPLSKLLQYSSDPIIPGLTGREDACITFLQGLQIRLKDGDTWRKWIDLETTERQRILSALAQNLLCRGFGSHHVMRIIGEVYLLDNETRGTELHDAKEFATLLNSTARGLCACDAPGRGTRPPHARHGRRRLWHGRGSRRDVQHLYDSGLCRRRCRTGRRQARQPQRQ